MRNLAKQRWGIFGLAVLACAGMAMPASAQRKMVTVPAGTSVLVRMIDTVDSSKSSVGARFAASLETNLEVEGVVLAPAGTKV